MPVYEYKCKKCGREFEYQQRMSDPDKTTCEACSGELERLISRTAFSLKGGGWYKDLYSSSKPEGSKSSDSGGSASGGGDAPAAAAPSTPAASSSSDSSSSSSSGSSSSGTGSGSGTGSSTSAGG